MPAATWIALLALAFYAAASLFGAGHGFDLADRHRPCRPADPGARRCRFAAVHHAEIIAHRTGEPYGTLVLTVAVTVIEVALIASVMLSEGGSRSPATPSTPSS